MKLLRNCLGHIIFFSIIFLFFGRPCNALNEGSHSFMDLEHSIQELKSLLDKKRLGVVSVSVYDDTGALINSGSGFFIDNKGRIITNASILKDAYSAGVASEGKTYSEISIININDDLDIALIKVKAENENALEMDFNEKTSLGERVIVIGKKTDLANTLSEGLISAFPKTEGTLHIFEIQTVSSILPNPTSNDGPVLDTDGKVIGVTGNTIFDKKISDGTWRGFHNDKMYAVSLSSIKPFLSESGNIIYLHPAQSKIWLRWFVRSLRSNFLEGFAFLYTVGPVKIIGFFLVSILILFVIEHLYVKYIKHR